MVSVVELRSKLVNLLGDYRKLQHEAECKNEVLNKIKEDRKKVGECDLVEICF